MTEEKTTKKTTKKTSKAKENEANIAKLEEQVVELNAKVDVLEGKLAELQELFITRSEWVDFNARLDIVEQEANQTLGKVRGKLETFTKEVRQVAVVPEKELNDLFELVKLVRRYLAPETKGR